MDDAPIDHTVFAALAESVGAEFVRELVDTFAVEAAGMREELRAAYEARDADRFRRTAHSLKSNAQTFGALRLAEAARALEHGGLPADAAPLDELGSMLAQSLAALAERANG